METTVTDRIASPEFAVVVRGYDRAQVDDYVGELLAWMSEAERRILATDDANEALRREVVQLRSAAASLEERAGVPGPQSLSAFSERIGEVMQSAVAAADDLRAQAEREANERRDAVAAEVERMIERAKAEAREILRRARSKERDLEENLVALAARRSAAVEELAQLHHELSELLARPEAASALGPGTRAARGLGSGGIEPAAALSTDSSGPPQSAAALPQAGEAEQAAGGAMDGADPAITQVVPAVDLSSSAAEPTLTQPLSENGGRRGVAR